MVTDYFFSVRGWFEWEAIFFHSIQAIKLCLLSISLIFYGFDDIVIFYGVPGMFFVDNGLS